MDRKGIKLSGMEDNYVLLSLSKSLWYHWST